MVTKIHLSREGLQSKQRINCVIIEVLWGLKFRGYTYMFDKMKKKKKDVLMDRNDIHKITPQRNCKILAIHKNCPPLHEFNSMKLSCSWS